VPLHPRPAAGGPPPRGKLGEDRRGLDSTWDRRLSRGTLAPDFTLDLHGHTLASAHVRLDDGLTQAKALGARVVLLITGKPRPSEAADRSDQRGAIRAKVLDWLAAGPHGSSIAAVRPAHRRHGGDGALYLVLRKRVGKLPRSPPIS
jgi:DNA-nicking Smr family endonuclease